ncbi:conjugative transposon protein TraM [Flavobacterium tructae]|uniref:conjugative transposon protein TraM n=1 Tax=Flavobacterium tructae TaxID=1114873 RepID=UPI002551FD1E|nr:conjugative transposon protein TraM [Flavobacterium tructae]MDL2141649.1 conjugative transposon protein TraM [Flavobacterium tructae]
MKENEKKVNILLGENTPNKVSNMMDGKKSSKERLKKPLIFGLMAVVFMGCMYLIFKPSEDKKEMENIGLNDAVPQASEAGMQDDKQKAYEQEMLEEKEQEKRKALTALSDYWDTSSAEQSEEGMSQEEQGYSYEPSKSNNPAINNYRNAQSTLSSFYQDNGSQTTELRKQIEELKEKLAEKDIPRSVTIDDQLTLMEKSYKMAAKYLPSANSTGPPASTDSATPASLPKLQKEYFTAFIPAKKMEVSSLYREPSDSVFLASWGDKSNRVFYTAGSVEQLLQPKNSVKACVLETQTIIGESGVRLRLLEPAKTSNKNIPIGTILTANTKFQGGRLQLKVSSIELQGNIVPVDITIYDLDGQQGLNVPYSPETNALNEMAGNMSQQSGTSLMMTQSAGQQIAADLSRGVVQGISGYFAKKVKTPKVTLKAGHQVFLVSKKQ